jgi:hypothetical protein
MDLLTRTAKRYHEELKLQGVSQIHSALFGTVDSSTDSNFLLDSLVQDPYGISYRNKDMQSVLRAYKPGSGTLLEVPRASEKTPISEAIRDAVAAGLEATAGFGANEASIVGKITAQHIAAHNMTKNKQAIDVILNGEFNAKGTGGTDLKLDIDYGRKSSLDLTYDFTQNGASFVEAVQNGQEELRANGTPLGGLVMLMGNSWLSAYSNDDKAQEMADNNMLNGLLISPMTPVLLNGTAGLFVVGQMRGKGMLAPVWLTSYSPGVAYKSGPDAAAAPFIADDKAAFFSLEDTRYSVHRGVDVLSDSGKAERKVGEIVFDSYNEKDPVNTFIRSSTRHAYVPANVNHTAGSTGIFA